MDDRDNSGERPDPVIGPDGDGAARTTDDYCRPFYSGGPLVEVVRRQLRERAKTLGWQLRQDVDLGGLHLVADDERIEPIRQGLSVCFQLPVEAKDVWLVSRTGRPCDVDDGTDSRTLGVCVAAVTVTDGFKSAGLVLDDPKVDEGFSRIEQNDDLTWRWTTGRAKLPADLWADCKGLCLLRVDLASEALPTWVREDDPPG